MLLPELEQWEPTRQALHQTAQVMGAVRRAVAAPRPNWVHLGLYPWERGITTGDLPVGALILDFEAGTLAYQVGRQQRVLSVGSYTQTGLAQAMEALLVDAGHALTLDHDKLTGEMLLHYDGHQGQAYAQVINFAWGVLAALRGALEGYQTELVLWPHGFDASFLWFAQPEQADESEGPHVGIGFSPGTPALERPYFYLYAWPLRDGIDSPTLPLPARWYAGEWTGIVIDYDMVRSQKQPATFLNELLIQAFKIMQNSLQR